MDLDWTDGSVNGLGKYECTVHGNRLITSSNSDSNNKQQLAAALCTIKQMHRVKCNVELWRV